MKRKLLFKKGLGFLGMAAAALLFSNTAAAQLSETFDNTSLPVGWSNTSSTGSTSLSALWKFSGNPGYAMSGTQDHTGNGGSFAWVDGSFPSGLTSILETDNVSMVGVVNPELRFWLKSDITGYTTTFNDFSVDIYDGANWNVGAFTFANNTANQDWEQFTVSLSGYTFTGPAKFRFNVGQFGSTAFYNDIALDDIEIVSVLDNDAGLSAMLTPVLPGCTVDSVVTVEMVNHGALNLTSATLNWSINGVLQTPSSWTGSLAQGAMDSIVVGTNNAIAFGDTISVWTSMPNGVPDSATFNDTVMLEYIAGYSGTKLIDPNGGGDFLSFADAMNKLEIYGMCGNLVVEAVDTTYVEQIEFPEIAGLDSSTSITFRSQSGNRDNVVLTFTSTSFNDNYVVKMEEIDNISFEDMTIWNQGATYAYGVDLRACDNITIDNCVIKSHYGTSSNGRAIYAYYLGTDPCNNFTLTNSVTDGGYYGLYYYGNFNNRGEGAHIENNQFLNTRYYGSYMGYANDIFYSNNQVESNTTYTFGYGMYFTQVSMGEITNNSVIGSNNWPRYGMALFTGSGDLSEWFNVSNNRIYLPNPSADYGMYISNCLFTDAANNSVFVEGDAFARGIYYTNGQYNQFRNNSVQVGGAGQGVYISGNPIYQMDYNNLSAPNGNVGYFGGNQATLADWQMATGFDSNSLSVNNVYSDTASLKVCTDSLYAMGTPLSHVMYDYEGDPRQNPPCIGADEFMPISMFGFSQSPVLCDGDTLVLEQNFYDTVVWNGTDTSSVYAVTNPQTVTVSVHDVCGTAADTFNVNSQSYASVADENLCEGTTADLATGISGGTYLWSNGSTDSTVTVDSAQVISVEVVDMHGCYSTDTAVVTQSYDATLPDSTQFCEGSSVTLDPMVPGTFIWSDNSTGATLSVNTPGNYCVTVTDLNCVSTACADVAEILNPVPSFVDSSDRFTVVFTNTSINTGANSTYHWDFGDGNTSSLENPIHLYDWANTEADTVTVTLTVSNECGDFVYQGEARYGNAVSVNNVDITEMISVYPNPSNGVFNVQLSSASSTEVTVEVMDIRGALVQQENLGKVNGQMTREINIEGAAAGIYFVKVNFNNQSAIYKLSVK